MGSDCADITLGGPHRWSLGHTSKSTLSEHVQDVEESSVWAREEPSDECTPTGEVCTARPAEGTELRADLPS